MANTIAHITREGLAQPSSTLANDELAYTTAGADRGNQHPPIDGVLTAQAKYSSGSLWLYSRPLDSDDALSYNF